MTVRRWQRQNQASPGRFGPSIQALEAGPAALVPFAPTASEPGTATAAPSLAWAHPAHPPPRGFAATMAHHVSPRRQLHPWASPSLSGRLRTLHLGISKHFTAIFSISPPPRDKADVLRAPNPQPQLITSFIQGGDTRSNPWESLGVTPTAPQCATPQSIPPSGSGPPPRAVPARGHSLESRQGFRSLQWLQIATLVPASSHVTDRS